MKFETILSAYDEVNFYIDCWNDETYGRDYEHAKQMLTVWQRQRDALRARLVKMYHDALGLRQELDAWERLSDLTSGSFGEGNDAPK